MKYAFIALIALYLIIYGCSPDSSEKAKKTHEPAAQTAVKDSHESKKAVAAIEHQQPEQAVQQEAKKVQPNIEAPAVIMEQPVVIEQKAAPVTEPEQVVLPCGRAMNRADIAANAPPCLKMHTPETIDTAAAAGTEQELEAALQKIVQTTNDMVLATRQLVIATQEVLKASKKPAGETPPVKKAAPAHQ